MPVDPWAAFQEKAAADPFAQYQEKPDFAANPPGIPAPPNAILRSPEAQAIDQARAAAVKSRGTYGPGVPAGYYEQGGTGPYQAQLTPKEQLTAGAQAVGMGAAAAIPALFPPASVLGRMALTGLASGAETKMGGGTTGQAALATGLGAAGQGAGEGVAALLSRIPSAAKFIPRLLNASGDVSPETLQNLVTAEPALRAGGAPKDLTQAGMTQHVRNLSTDIDSKIAPIIKQAASKDVSASTAQIAQNLRAEITPEMKRVNPGTANMLEKLASSAEDTKTLGSLDELRKQLNDRRYAVKPNAIVRPYISKTLNDVLDTIAEHAQQVRPDMAVRSMRSQQAALMKLGDVFETSAAKGQTQLASQQGLTMGQKIGQKLPELIQAATNPKAALAKKLVQPSTSEQLLQQAFKGQRAYAPPTQAAIQRILNSSRLLGKAPIEMGSAMEPIGATSATPRAATSSRAERLGLLLAEKAGLSRPIQMGSAMEPIGTPSAAQSALPYRPSLQRPAAFVRPGEIRPPANMELLPPYEGGMFSIDVPAGSSARAAGIRRSSDQFIQDVIQRRGLPSDPQLADVEAAVKGRAAEVAQKYPVPQYQSTRDPFAPPQTPADVYNPQVVQQHASAMEQAKSELGGKATLSDLLMRAAQIQRGGR